MISKLINFVKSLFAKTAPSTVDPVVSPIVPEQSIVTEPVVEQKPTWEETKAALLVGNDTTTNKNGSDNPHKYDSLSVMFDNTKKELDSVKPPQHQQATNTSSAPKIILPVARSCVANMLAWDIVGVQAMKAPTDTITVLRTDGTNLKETNAQVEEKVKKLIARWTFESFVQITGIDIEAEIMAALAQETVVELDQELLAYLRKLAVKNSASIALKHDSSDSDLLANGIIGLCNTIAKTSQRGAGNWVVGSSIVWNLLKDHPLFEKIEDDLVKKQIGTKYVGKLNKTISVYIDPWASDSVPALVGYRGSEPMDNGVQFCPYVPLSSSGVVINPNTFEPVLTFMTSYGLYEMQSTPEYPVEAADFYALLNLVEDVKPQKPKKGRKKQA